MNLILQVAVVGGGPQTHETNYTTSAKKPKPVVMLIGADWCEACMVMKNQTMPAVERTGALKNVAYYYVDVDNEPKLAKRFLKGQSIPQLVRLEKEVKGWHIDRLTGAHKVEKVSKFVRHIDVHPASLDKAGLEKQASQTRDQKPGIRS